MKEEISLGLFGYSEALYGSDVSVGSDIIGGILVRRCLIKWYFGGKVSISVVRMPQRAE